MRLEVRATVLALLVTALGGGCRDQERAWAPGSARQVAATPATLWMCGMHPEVVRDAPGRCPICGMALSPVGRPDGDSTLAQARSGPEGAASTAGGAPGPPGAPAGPDPARGAGTRAAGGPEDDAAGAPVRIDGTLVQRMGVRTVPVEVGPLRRTLRAAGVLAEVESRQYDVTVRVAGRIDRLHAAVEGMYVRRGAPLFDLSSPELRLAIEDLIAARQHRDGQDGNDDARAAAETVYRAAADRLRTLGLTARMVDALARKDAAPPSVRFFSPVEGYVTAKPVVEGSAVEPGERVLRIVDYRELWLDVQVPASSQAWLRRGARATARLQGFPERVFTGTVDVVDPRVDPQSRTVRARVTLPNPDLVLRSGQYATVEIAEELERRAVLVPRDAVLDTGRRQLAFVALGDGRFEPRRVRLGADGDDGVVEVLEGLAPGEPVVVTGQFLIDAESRLQEALRRFGAGAAAGADHAAHAH